MFLQLWRYFELRRLTDDWIRFTKFALLVARGLGDREREANALGKLGGACRQARRFEMPSRVPGGGRYTARTRQPAR